MQPESRLSRLTTLIHVLDKFTGDDRVLMVMHWMYGHSIPEIAFAFGEHELSIQNRLDMLKKQSFDIK